MDTIELRQGTGDAFVIDLTDETTSEPKAYTGEEVVTCRVWAGDDQMTLVTPQVTWQDASVGALGLVVSDSDTAALEPGRYILAVDLVEAGITREVFRAYLKVTPAPGEAEPLSSYCTYEDLLRYSPRLDLEQVDGVQAGFAEARHQARQWIDSQLLKKDSRNRGYQGLLPEVKTWLAADALMVDATVVEIAARKALGIIYATAFSPGAKDNDKFVQFAARQDRKAETLFFSNTFELDTNQDGQADYWIECHKIIMRGYNNGCV